MQKCGFGKNLHMPCCDGSHNRSEKQYAEWKRQIDLEQQKSDSIKK
jgi:CDGSH-type Zn-finger protein